MGAEIDRPICGYRTAAGHASRPTRGSARRQQRSPRPIGHPRLGSQQARPPVPHSSGIWLYKAKKPYSGSCTGSSGQLSNHAVLDALLTLLLEPAGRETRRRATVAIQDTTAERAQPPPG